MPFEFTPRAPKPTRPIDKFKDLEAAIASDNVPDTAKLVGDGIVRLYMTGPVDFYVRDSGYLRQLLNRYGVTY